MKNYPMHFLMLLLYRRTYIDSFDAINHDGDTTEIMTRLGSQLTNPYLIPNIQQAYANLGITNVSVTGLQILITNWATDAMTPMLHKRWSNYFPQEAMVGFVANDISSIAGGLNMLGLIIFNQIDLMIGFRIAPGVSFFSKTSDDIKEMTYHELTHAAHYSKNGDSWYAQFVNAEISGIVANGLNGTYSPYGRGNDSYSPIIALGESWANHMRHFMADMRYGTLSTAQNEQGMGKSQGSNGGIGAHINVLEYFDPNYTTDPFYWIPKGLYEDLLDTRNEIRPPGPVTDNTSAYTNQQMFNAFNSSITTLQGYKTNLLNTTSNSTSGSVNSLFSQYGY